MFFLLSYITAVWKSTVKIQLLFEKNNERIVEKEDHLKVVLVFLIS